jgi:prophage regulatory protein
MIRAGQFPAPRQLGARAVAWPEAEITAWIESRTVSAHWAASAV